MEDKEVPAHSNRPASRDTPKVMKLGCLEILSSFKKLIKLAVESVSYERLDPRD